MLAHDVLREIQGVDDVRFQRRVAQRLGHAAEARLLLLQEPFVVEARPTPNQAVGLCTSVLVPSSKATTIFPSKVTLVTTPDPNFECSRVSPTAKWTFAA